MHKDKPYNYIPVKVFAEAYQSFHVGQRIGDELATPYDKSKSHPAALSATKYGASKMGLLKACIAREFLLMKRNSFVYVFKMMQVSNGDQHGILLSSKLANFIAKLAPFFPFSAHSCWAHHNDSLLAY